MSESKIWCVMTLRSNVSGEWMEYKIPVHDVGEVHALSWVMRDKELGKSFDLEEYTLPHPMYTLAFSEEHMRHTVTGLTYATALWLFEQLASVDASPTMTKTDW